MRRHHSKNAQKKRNKNRTRKSHGIGSLATGDLTDAEIQETLKKELDMMSQIKGVSHIATNKIFMKHDRPIKQRYYPRNPAMQAIINKQVDVAGPAGCRKPTQAAPVGRQAPARKPIPTPTTATTRQTMATPTTRETTTATTRQTITTPTTRKTTTATKRQPMTTTTTKETTRQTTDNEARPLTPRTTTGTKRNKLADFQRPQTKWVTPRRLSSLDHPGTKRFKPSEESEEDWEPKPRGYDNHMKRVEEAVTHLKTTWRRGNRRSRLVVSDNLTTRIRIGRSGHIQKTPGRHQRPKRGV
ncbi:endochitinase A-like [Drosophila rhopaloa]|uniref:Uncharacterized protein n=1 Tax=Drosophila rhopaloa TaxID=1041015 RepID=A0ABM5JDW6_DRORH|nr:endochitinase A-like [Drosophila rhopaloa]XP_044317016.1 endochitinase A-like [Drosophila rhopaloa]